MARFRKKQFVTKTKDHAVERSRDNITKWEFNCRDILGCSNTDQECLTKCANPRHICYIKPDDQFAIPGFSILENAEILNGTNIITETCIPINKISYNLLDENRPNNLTTNQLYQLI